MEETGQTSTTGQKSDRETGIMTDVIMSALSNAPVLSEAKTHAVEYLEQFQDLKIVDTETYKSAKAYFSEIRATRLELSKKFAGVTTTLKSLAKVRRMSGKQVFGVKIMLAVGLRVPVGYQTAA